MRKVGGRRHTRSLPAGTTIPEAEQQYHSWVVEILAEDERARNPQSRVPTWGEIVQAYLDRLQAKGTRKVRQYASGLALFTAEWGADTPLDQITVEMVKAAQTRLRTTRAPGTVDYLIAYGSAAWNHSTETIPNPFARVRKFYHDNRLTRWLSDDEQQAILDALESPHPKWPQHFREMILVLMFTGLREEAVLRLHSDQLDFVQSVIRFRQKGDRSHTVPMPRIVAEALRRIAPDPPGWIFPNPQTGEPRRGIRDSFASLKAAAGIIRPFRVHDFRHNFGTRLARIAPLPTVQYVLGHADIKTTMRYVHPVSEDMRRAVEEMGEMIESKRGGQRR